MPLEADSLAHKRDPSGDAPPGVTVTIPATNDAVRGLLQDLGRLLDPMEVGADAMGSAEIVLAELLNNIVEHAYENVGKGEITVELDRYKTLLVALITDHGKPMPGNRVPHRKSADLDVPRQDLPEGGFGWFLIYELVEDLCYMRNNNANMVRFSIRLG